MNNTSINIIPKPKSVITLNSSFDLNSLNGINIENNSKYEKYIANLFKSYLEPLKNLEIEHATIDPKNKINISLSAKHNLGKEEYKLKISDLDFITIEASYNPGLFYGFQSFRQLCDPSLEKGLKPIALKDNIDAVGFANTAGSMALKQNFPKEDAFLVQKLLKGGYFIQGKTNLSEWANFRSTSSTSGWSTLGGQTANPFGLNRNPCGSSSGSAVAVALGLCLIHI